jgi:hypothetical protein
MKTNSFTKMTAGVFALALFGISNSEAGHEDRNLVRLAHEVEDQAEDLRDEFKRHFRHSGSYRHLMSDLDSIEEDVEHIDKLAHNLHRESLLHVKKDIEGLDKSVHHLSEVVEAVERGRYGGHIDGDTRHVRSLIASMNRTLHAMDDIVADELRACGNPHQGHDYDRSRSSQSSWGRSWSSQNNGNGNDFWRGLVFRFASR